MDFKIDLSIELPGGNIVDLSDSSSNPVLSAPTTHSHGLNGIQI